MPPLLTRRDDALDRQAGLGRLDDARAGREWTLALPRLTTTPRSPPLTTTPSMMSPTRELELALVVLQLDGLDHPVGEAGAELEEGHVLADLDDLAGHLLARLEAAAGRAAAAGVGVHVGEGALLGGRGLGGAEAARRAGGAGAGGLARTGVPARLARGRAGRRRGGAAAAAGAAGPPATPPARPPGRRRPRGGRPGWTARRGGGGAGRGRERTGHAGLRVGQPLPERAVVLGRRGGRRPSAPSCSTTGVSIFDARGRGLHVPLADDDGAGFALLLVRHGARVITRR